MTRRTFTGAALAAGLAACKESTWNAPFELDEVSIADLSAGLRSGRWTTHRLVF